jgi:hypothetical protein
MNPAGWVLTFVSVAVTMAFFRATTIASAIDIVKGLVGLNGVALPQGFFDRAGSLGAALHAVGVVADRVWSVGDCANLGIWIFVQMFIALVCPNTLRILSQFEPALGVKPRPAKPGIGWLLRWNASLPWAVAVSGIAAVAINSISGPSEFLYWQF